MTDWDGSSDTAILAIDTLHEAPIIIKGYCDHENGYEAFEVSVGDESPYKVQINGLNEGDTLNFIDVLDNDPPIGGDS